MPRYNRLSSLRVYNSVLFFIQNYIVSNMKPYEASIPDISLSSNYSDHKEILKTLKDPRSKLQINQVLETEGKKVDGFDINHHLTFNFLEIADNTDGIVDEIQLYLIMKYRFALVKVGEFLTRELRMEGVGEDAQLVKIPENM